MNTSRLRRLRERLIVGASDALLPLITDSGVVGDQRAFAQLLVESRFAEAERALALTEAPAAVFLGRQRSIHSRQVVGGRAAWLSGWLSGAHSAITACPPPCARSPPACRLLSGAGPAPTGTGPESRIVLSPPVDAAIVRPPEVELRQICLLNLR